MVLNLAERGSCTLQFKLLVHARLRELPELLESVEKDNITVSQKIRCDT